MPRPSEEFKTNLTTNLTKKSDGKQLILFDGLIDKLLELLMGLFDQCLGQLSPGQVAARVSSPSGITKIRFRSRVRKNIYDSSSDYRRQGGQNVADSVLETTQEMGLAKCAELVAELTEGDEFFPHDEFKMG